MRFLKIRSSVGLALTTIREHKMRAFLTVLGVIIGTGTIIGVGSSADQGRIANSSPAFGSKASG